MTLENELKVLSNGLKEITQGLSELNNQKLLSPDFYESAILQFVNTLGYTELESSIYSDNERLFTIFKSKQPIFQLLVSINCLDTRKKMREIKDEVNKFNCHFLIITNLIEFSFFSKLYMTHVFSTNPFFEFNISNIDKPKLELLTHFSKSNFKREQIISSFGCLKLEKALGITNSSNFFPF